MDNIIRFSLRIPKKLYQAVKQAAKVNRRSVNSQILSALEEWLNDQGPQDKVESNN